MRRLFTVSALVGLLAALVPAPAAGVTWGEIAGTVTDESTGLPVAGIVVGVSPWSQTAQGGTTNAAGEYVIRFLEPGDYVVLFVAEWGAIEQPGYLPEYWDDKPDVGTADVVTVPAGGRVSNIDAALAPAGRITGTVVNEWTGAPLAGVRVTAQTCRAFCSGGWAETGTDGTYVLSGPGLATADYKVVFNWFEPESGLEVVEWWEDRSGWGAWDEASWIHVTAGSTVAGIDAALMPWHIPWEPDVIRVSGVDRYETAAVLALYSHGTGSGGVADVPVVYVATGENYPDALAGGSAAAQAGAPLLLVRHGSVPAATRTVLEILDPDEIVVLGGPAAVSAAVEADLARLAPVRRLAGADRYGTAAAISADSFPGGAAIVYVATGENYPDALAGAPAAAVEGAPILLVRRDAVPAATAGELARLDPDEIVVLGGAGAISDLTLFWLGAHAPTVRRLAGADRYDTAAAVCADLAPGDPVFVDTVYITTGMDYPDALAAGAGAGGGGASGDRAGPILLVDRWIPWETAEELRRIHPKTVVIVGGPGAVDPEVEKSLVEGWF